jgi:hypothetical protein
MCGALLAFRSHRARGYKKSVAMCRSRVVQDSRAAIMATAAERETGLSPDDWAAAA